jgi:putative ABC transport system substrate-binding protein
MMLIRAALAVALVLGLLAAPLAAEAQQARSVPVIGILTPAPAGESPTGLPGKDPLLFALRDLGYIEGNSIHLEYRSSAGRDDQFPTLARELVALKADVIVAATVPAIRAAQRATPTIPIVMVFSSDPVRLGLIKSLAHPGGNTTGLASLTFDLSRKRVELLKEIVPKLSHLAVLLNPTNPAIRDGLSETKVAAQALGVRVEAFEVREPAALDAAFVAILRARPNGLVVVPDPIVAALASRIQAFAAKNRLPAIYGGRAGFDDGGLMSYGIDLVEHVGRAARYIDKILKGAKPADLPVEQPTKFELVINLKTAKALGLTIPPSLLQRADRIIE